jgi:trehalose 6-phosphate synthase/phosphatase
MVESLLRRLRSAEHLVLLLDYDGTLVPFAPTPELAVPDEDLRALLRALAGRPHTMVHVVSGRTRETLESWLGDLPIGLYAEHGLWSHAPGTPDWTAPDLPAAGWRPGVLAILQDFAARTPGSLVEEKTASLAWHYRATDPEYGASQANELRVHLTQILSNEPVQLLAGDHVIEVRPHGLEKGRVPREVAESAPSGALFVALGDDRTDEDLFAALPPTAWPSTWDRGPARPRFACRTRRQPVASSGPSSPRPSCPELTRAREALRSPTWRRTGSALAHALRPWRAGRAPRMVPGASPKGPAAGVDVRRPWPRGARRPIAARSGS